MYFKSPTHEIFFFVVVVNMMLFMFQKISIHVRVGDFKMLKKAQTDYLT